MGSSASLTAVETGDPADRIRNSGVIVGSVDLGKGRNRFVNRGRGMFLPGETVDLGRNGRLTNRGTVVLGAVAGGHRLAGDFVQREKGVLRLVLDGSHDADEPLVHVQGRVRLAGEIDPVVPDARFLQSGQGTLRLLRARDGLGEDDLRRLTIEDEENASYELVRDGDELALRYEIEVDEEQQEAGLDGNEQEVAQALGALSASGELDQELLAAVAGTDLEAYAGALQRLSAASLCRQPGRHAVLLAPLLGLDARLCRPQQRRPPRGRARLRLDAGAGAPLRA